MHGRWLGWGALITAAAALSPACDDGSLVQRGFDSRQLATLRDPTFTFYAAQDDQVFYVTGRDSFGNGTPTYWSIDVGTGEIRNLGSTMPHPSTPPAASRYKCEYGPNAQGLSTVLSITDTQSGRFTAIERVAVNWPSCPTDDDPTLALWRIEDDGTYTLWLGPYFYLEQAALPFVVHQLLWREADRTLVGAPSTEAPGGLGIYAVADRDPSLVTEIVPATLADVAWADGAVPSTTLESSGLAETSQTFFLGAAPGHYIYSRQMADGSRVMFAGPYASGGARELGLFPVLPDDRLMLLRIEPYNYRYDGDWPLTSAWSSIEGDPPVTTFRIWRDASARLATCTWPGDQAPTALGDPAGENALFVKGPTSLVLAADSALLVMVPNAPVGDRCRTLATADVSLADFSPDGTAIAWLVEPLGDRATLWTAGRDGSAPRAIGTGNIYGVAYIRSTAPHFVGDSQLELTIDGDLVWVDVHDDPVRTHHVTERVFGAAIDLGRWVVTGHDYSEQDASGRLALVNRDSGETRAISPAVSQYMSPDVSSFGTTPGVFHDDGTPIRIVYLVRGRNPSSQDGLWVATIAAEDRK